MQLLQPKQMHWVRADSSDFGGDRPAPRRYPAHLVAAVSISILNPTLPAYNNLTVFAISCSGHTAVSIGKSKVIVFGGFADKRFLSDVSVYDIGNQVSLQFSKRSLALPSPRQSTSPHAATQPKGYPIEKRRLHLDSWLLAIVI